MIGLVVLQLAVTATSSFARGSATPPSPSAAPTVDSCLYYPDPRVNVSIDCADPFGNEFQPAYVNLTVRFLVNVSDPDPENMSVTFHFDYLNYNASGGPPFVNPSGPVQTINVSNPNPGTPARVEANWTYEGYWTADNFTDTSDPSTATSAKYLVLVEVQNETGNGTQFPLFRITVNKNTEPFLNGLSSLIFASETVRPEAPVIPLIYANVTVGDSDADPVIVTWFWGDGTVSVNRTGPPLSPIPLNVTHQYPVSQFPLNESPRYVEFPIRVTLDDGAAHNVSNPSIAEFYIGFDFLPTVRVSRPAVASAWKVGEPVPLEGNVTDPEGGNTTAYWDFDNRTDTNGDGDPTNDRDANGTSASHTYLATGNVTVTLWGTDGENKVLCLDQVSCTANATGFQSHWVPRPVPITVRDNIPPFPAVSNGTAEKGRPFVLHASVYDQDGDNMTVTWVFDDGSPNATIWTGPSPRDSPQVFAVTQAHTFTTIGVHTFRVLVSDGTATVEQSGQIIVESFNLPPARPVFEILRSNGTVAVGNTFQLNETVVIRVLVSDPENDTVDITVDWADGNISTAQVNFTTSSDCNLTASGNSVLYICAVTLSHAYPDRGPTDTQRFEVLVTATDHQEYYRVNPAGGVPIQFNHAPSQVAIIFVTNTQYRGLGPWDWWDYSTFAVFIGVPSILVGGWVRSIRRERREE